jgi:guanylate kinase
MTKASHETSPQIDRLPTPLLIVLSGPSGAGKDALLTRLRDMDYPLEYITTLTTRSKRAEERDNIDYHFVSPDKFQEMIENNELLEWANVYGNWYGVPKKPVKKALESGRNTIVKVDTQGAANIKKLLPEAVFVFLMPPSLEELTTRLTQRRTESPFDLARRIKTARQEIAQLPLFDYVIVSNRDEIDQAVAQIKAIIAAEGCRVRPRQITL